MKRVRLGKTDMYVNAIGLGCMGLTHASGLPTPKEEAVEILRKAHDMGYDFYDQLNVIQELILMEVQLITKKLLVKLLNHLEKILSYVLNLVLNIWVITLNLIVHQKQLENS